MFDFKESKAIREYVEENIFLYQTKELSINVYGKHLVSKLILGYLNAGILRVMDNYVNVNNYLDDIIIKGVVSAKKIRDTHLKCADILRKNNRSLDDMRKATIGINTAMTEASMLMRGIGTRDISMLDIFDLMMKDEEAYKILTENDPVSSDMTPLEIVDAKKLAFKKLEDIINKNKMEPFYTLLRAGSGIRLAQLVDTMCFIGCNPDWDVMIPHVVADSWLRGIGASRQDPKGAFYVTQLAARIAKKLEKCDIAITGWVLKQQMFIMKNTRVSEVDDCGTIHHTTVFVESIEDIKRHKGMYYKINHYQNGYNRINGDESHLVGLTLLFRTPATCNTVDGNICKTCLGIDAISGYDIGLEIGAFIYAMAGQNYLSAKHNTIANPLNPIYESDRDILKVTIQNIITWKIKPSMMTCGLKIPTDKYIEFSSAVVIIAGKTRTITLNGTNFYTMKNNITEDNIIINIDEVYIRNKNIPKAALFRDLQSIFYASSAQIKASISDDMECESEDAEDSDLCIVMDDTTESDIDLDKVDTEEVKVSNEPIQEVIRKVYNITEGMHAVIPYMLIHKNIRCGDNLFNRPDFTKEDARAVFVTSRGLLKYLSITDSLPQGVSIGVDGILTSPETYLEEREKDNSMDVIFVPRTTTAEE